MKEKPKTTQEHPLGALIAQASYEATSAELSKALRLAAAATHPKKNYGILLVWTCFAAFVLPISLGAGLVFVAMDLYTVYTLWGAPQVKGLRQAQKIAKKQNKNEIAIYERGVEFTEGEKTSRCRYSNLSEVETTDAFVLLEKEETLYVLPKRCLGEQLNKVQYLFYNKMTEHYHAVKP